MLGIRSAVRERDLRDAAVRKHWGFGQNSLRHFKESRISSSLSRPGVRSRGGNRFAVRLRG